MATIGKVNAVFTASAGGLRVGVNQAVSSMQRMQSQVNSLRGSMRTLVAINGAQLFGSIASSAGYYLRSLIQVGHQQAEVIDKSSKMAARLGMTYGEFAGLSLAADLAGVSMESVGNAATKADVMFAKAANGSKTAAAAFSAIGLSVEQLNGLSAAERFDAIAQAISALPTEAQRAAAAVQIFGRAGAQLLPLFQDGAGGIRQAREEAEKFGLALSTAQGRDVERMNDTFTKVYKVINGIVQQVVANLAPAITAISEQFISFVTSIGGVNIGQAIGNGILEGARYLAQVGDYLITAIPRAWEYVKSLGEYWSSVFEVGKRIFSYFATVGRIVEAAFKFVGSILVGTLGRVLNAVGELMQFVPGLASAGRGIEKSGESLMRTSKKLWEEAGSAVVAAAENYVDTLFGSDQAASAGEAAAGPLTAAIDAGRRAAEQSAASISEATRKPIEIRQAVETKVSAEAVKQAVEGIDSRSSEGLKTMFRIMRGDTGNDVQERMARGIERIADNTDDLDMEFDVADLAPAAGA